MQFCIAPCTWPVKKSYSSDEKGGSFGCLLLTPVLHGVISEKIGLLSRNETTSQLVNHHVWNLFYWMIYALQYRTCEL